MMRNIPPRTHGANSPRRPDEVRRDRALDQDRVASMADEGGAAAATVDLDEQLAHARSLASCPPQPKRSLIWGGPLAAAAAGVLAGMLLWRRHPAHAR